MEMIDFEKLTVEQKKLFLLKQRMNCKNPEEVLAFEEKVFMETDNIKEMLGYMSPAFIGLIKGDMREVAAKTQANYESVVPMYHRILKEANILAKEMGLKTSLEYANLFVFLLWRGYFSENKSLQYKVEGRENTLGLFSFDIMQGIGVCLNFSQMLTDYLNSGSNTAATLNVFCGNNIKIDYRYPVERNLVKEKFYIKILIFFLSRIAKKAGNHALTLIDENGKLYIYDATNLCILGIDDCYKAHIISGHGEMEIKPFMSYLVSNSEKERDLLEKLINGEHITAPYDAASFRDISEANNTHFLDNMPLVEDFYLDVHSDIVGIASELKRVRKNSIDVK